MAIRPFLYSFNGGEVSPEFEGRADHQRYFTSLRTCLNGVTRPLGGVRRRSGTRFVAAAKTALTAVRLMPFEFSVTQAYVLEVGHQYIRFYKDGARLENPPGTPVEVVTPYDESHVFAMQTAQSADVMWFVHPSYPPYKLSRFSDTSWSFQPIAFDPPPSTEAPVIAGVGLTLSATSGSAVTATAAGAIFLDGDVGRQLTLTAAQGSQARGIITAVNAVAPTAAVTLNIIAAFPGTSISAGAWQLEGPLGVGLRLSPVGGKALKGVLFKALLLQRDMTAAELITNGTFSGLGSWTDHSGVTLAAGNHTGGTGTNLQDTSKHFPALGVRVGMRVINTASGQSGTIASITPDGHSLAVGITFNAGEGYTIIGSGGAEATNGGGQLSGGNAGTGWIEQAISTVNGQIYRVTFDVEEGPLACQVGATSRGSELFGEASFSIGLQREVLFTAVSGTSYVQFRNNQPTMSRVKRASAKNVSAAGWRSADAGSFIKAHNGVFEILGFDSASSANVLCRSVPDPIQGASVDIPAGAWTLEVPAWSASRGYPRAISFHQQRLGFAGTALQPLTVWQSEIGAYESFGASALADSSLEQEFSANTMNVILWMEPFRDLLVGTAAGEHLLRGVNGPLTPTNGEQLPQTRVGSHGLQPIRHDNAIIVLQRGGRQIKELIIDDVGATIRGKDHTLLANHITESGIIQWAMQSKPEAILWAVRHDGTLIGLTYEQVEEVQGWHRHTTPIGFTSVCVVPINAPVDARTEDVYVCVLRGAVQYIERLDPDLALDSALSYSGPPASILSGLGHLEGATVSVVDKSSGSPAILQDRVVSGGSITLERQVTAADVGLPYTMRIEPQRPEVPLRDGTLQGRMKRWIKVSARMLNALGITINGEEAILRTPSDAMDAGMAPRNGDAEVMDLGWTEDGYLTIEQSDPLPATILAVYGELDVEEGN